MYMHAGSEPNGATNRNAEAEIIRSLSSSPFVRLFPFLKVLEKLEIIITEIFMIIPEISHFRPTSHYHVHAYL